MPSTCFWQDILRFSGAGVGAGGKSPAPGAGGVSGDWWRRIRCRWCMLLGIIVEVTVALVGIFVSLFSLFKSS